MDYVTGNKAWYNLNIAGNWVDFSWTGGLWIDSGGGHTYNFVDGHVYDVVIGYDPVNFRIKAWIDGVLQHNAEVRSQPIGFDIRPLFNQYDWDGDNPCYADDVYLKRERS